MTITINFIEGRRQSACKNDSFSIVANEGTREACVLAFIPTESLEGKSATEIGAVFTNAVKGQPEPVLQAVNNAAQRLKIPSCTL